MAQSHVQIIVHEIPIRESLLRTSSQIELHGGSGIVGTVTEITPPTLELGSSTGRRECYQESLPRSGGHRTAELGARFSQDPEKEEITFAPPSDPSLTNLHSTRIRY